MTKRESFITLTPGVHSQRPYEAVQADPPLAVAHHCQVVGDPATQQGQADLGLDPSPDDHFQRRM
jgi:hypothetical protein